jgi:type II secretory pathway pseudopilin PulG
MLYAPFTAIGLRPAPLRLVGGSRIAPPSLKARAFTLLELLLAVFVLFALATIVIPQYVGYQQTVEASALRLNIHSMASFQEQYRSENGQYAVSLDSRRAIEVAIGWRPHTTQQDVLYRILPGDGQSYEVIASAPDGTEVCLQMPQGTQCPSVAE